MFLRVNVGIQTIVYIVYTVSFIKPKFLATILKTGHILAGNFEVQKFLR